MRRLEQPRELEDVVPVPAEEDLLADELQVVVGHAPVAAPVDEVAQPAAVPVVAVAVPAAVEPARLQDLGWEGDTQKSVHMAKTYEYIMSILQNCTVPYIKGR